MRAMPMRWRHASRLYTNQPSASAVLEHANSGRDDRALPSQSTTCTVGDARSDTDDTRLDSSADRHGMYMLGRWAPWTPETETETERTLVAVVAAVQSSKRSPAGRPSDGKTGSICRRWLSRPF